MDRVDWTRLEHEDPLAFAYVADVSLEVENATAAVSPTLSHGVLREVLDRKPEWLRPAWLKSDWPIHFVDSTTELLQFGLTTAKALLAVGAKVPDGSSIDMERAHYRIFPDSSSRKRERGAIRVFPRLRNY